MRDWNTNSKTARQAQTVLHIILRHYSIDALLSVPRAPEVCWEQPFVHASGCSNVRRRQILSGILPYAERHYNRTNELLVQSYLLDYSLHAMDRHNPAGTEALQAQQ